MESLDKSAKIVLPIFDGTNYPDWSSSMKGWFLMQGAWRIVQGEPGTAPGTYDSYTRPTQLTPATAANTTEINAWVLLDEKARGAITMYIAPHLRDQLTKGQTTSYALWAHIRSEYGTPGAVAAFVLFQKMVGYTFTDSKPLTPQILSFLSLNEKLSNAGLNQPERQVALMLLNAMPRSYQGTASNILSTKQLDTLKPTDIIPTVQAEESRRTASHQPHASSSRIHRVSTTKPLQRHCNKCGKDNHTTENCWGGGAKPSSGAGGYKGKGKAKDTGRNSGGNKRKSGKHVRHGQLQIESVQVLELPDLTSGGEISSISLYTVTGKTTQWMMDSGCTKHCTNNINDFVNYTKFNTPGRAALAGQNLELPIEGFGSIRLRCRTISGKQIDVKMGTVLYIPQCSGRYFSTTMAVDEGMQFLITAKGMSMLRNTKPILAMKRVGDLFFLPARIMKPPALRGHTHRLEKVRGVQEGVTRPSGPSRPSIQDKRSSSVRASESTPLLSQPRTALGASEQQLSAMSDYDLWHFRFGHSNERVIQNLDKNTQGVPHIKIPADKHICQACLEGRSKRSSYPESASRAKLPLELVHSDLDEFPILTVDGHYK